MSWQQSLPEKVKVSLEKLLDRVNGHEDSYSRAENQSVAQIWTALALMNQRMEKLEELVIAQRKAINEVDADVDVDSHLDRNLEDSLRNY